MPKHSSAMFKKLVRFPIAWLAITLSLVLMLCFRYQHDLEPLGCDPFGYDYQAQLFRQHGVGGLDTAISTPQSQLLIALSEQAFPNQTDWFNTVAPHCYHYEPRTGKVILQYPPGTGLVLALFPAAYAMPAVEIVGALLVAVMLLAVAIRRRLSYSATLALMLAATVLYWMLARNLTYWSVSVPITALLIPPFAVISRRFTDRSIGLAVLLGLVGGLLSLVRLPNVLLLLCPLVQETLRAHLWQWKQLRPRITRILAAAAGLIVGLTPLGVANQINTGSIFRTTYAAYDASLPVHNWKLMESSLRYYFSAPLGAPVMYVALFVLVAGYLYWHQNRLQGMGAALIGASGMLLLSLLFFATHSIHAHYYLIPSALMVIFAVCVAWSDQPLEKTSISRWLWTLPLVLITFAALHHTKPYQFTATLPSVLRDPENVVWADMTSGALYPYANRYAAAFKGASAPQRNALVDLVRTARHEQYFVVDSASIRAICDQQAARYGVNYAGVAKLFLPTAVWKLSDDGSGQRNCEPPQALPMSHFK